MYTKNVRINVKIFKFEELVKPFQKLKISSKIISKKICILEGVGDNFFLKKIKNIKIKKITKKEVNKVLEIKKYLL
jgi:hypothetical protein